MPFSYFPVMMPQARGDQETTPTPAAQDCVFKLFQRSYFNYVCSCVYTIYVCFYQSYGKALATAFPLYPSGINDIRPVHTQEESD